jgi:outer membrane receptor protein involved in Fe transport
VTKRGFQRHALLLCGAATIALATAGFAEAAEAAKFDIPAQPLSTALAQFGVQSQHGVFADSALTSSKLTQGVSGEKEAEVALNELLAGTGLAWRRDGQSFIIMRASDPQSGSAAGDGAEGTVQALIVTAQKREEDIQDVPIAISAFTQEDLTRSQVAGGPDLMTQVPNFTFTKTNFSSYSIQIRGIGTQAISATTDAAVAIAFNNTSFIRNRFFEQEFYDLQRVEVLRGPQGTLYGRNATAGVVNIISAKPSFRYEARLSGDVSNYNSSRIEGMINLPLVEDKVALRLAGAWTKRDGYATNELTGDPIDGRDLWSTRLSLRFEPTDNIHANLIWEHFQEDDDRLRSGKQLCNTDEITEVAGMPVGEFESLPNVGQGGMYPSVAFSQGCKPASLYAPESFQVPNGLSLPYYYPLSFVFLPAALTNPYVRRTQSNDLRVIESTVDPKYRAKTDVAELQLSIDLADDLTLTSETGYLSDFLFSSEDYNRFNTIPGAWRQPTPFDERPGVLLEGPNGGIFCDPQIGCADRLVAIDLSTARSRQFSQELRLASNYSGPFNFSVGANFLRYDTEDKYYVFVNSLSLISAISPYGGVGRPLPPYDPATSDNLQCLPLGMAPPDFHQIQDILNCTYMDPNPINNLNDLGHNYFLSKNPYKLISYAVFGEAYYNIAENLKLTAGLRWTVDKKEAPSIPSWVLASDSVGYPVNEVIEQEWNEPTGRLTLDWKPDLSFTDETLLYASMAHGYKAGGANPPPAGATAYCSECGANANVAEAKVSVTHPKTFDPEFVNAFELGSKNTLLDGRLTLNGDAFYYDYTGYQISQIVDRSALNLNFDAKVWGLELEADWRPLENLRLGFKGGYENTRVADGEKAIDLMDRTAGNPDWVLVRPFPTYTANCIMPKWLMVGSYGGETPVPVALGGVTGGNPGGCELAYSLGWDPVTEKPYQLNPDPSTAYNHRNVDYAAWNPDLSHYPGWPTGVPLGTTYPGWDPSTAPNHGEGIDKDLSGNELPNAPHFTATITADYTIPLPNSWLATLHTDLYYQSEAWTRIFNMPGYDKLKAYTNVNLAAIFSNEDAGWKIMAYVKNVMDRDSITGAFLNSDDTGLTTNVFLTEPRLYGLRVTKEWTGEGWWTGANPNHTGPFPLTVEIGGQVQRQDAPYGAMAPSFAGSFSDALDTFASTQNRDLDKGDARELKITYRPGGGSWSVSAGVRYGRANTDTTRVHREEVSGEKHCAFPLTGYYASFGRRLCDPTYVIPGYEYLGPGYLYSPSAFKYGTNFSDSSARTQEDHLIADFDVGKDVGLGAIGAGHSSLAAGLRYASFNSRTWTTARGTANWDIPDAWFFKYSSVDRFAASTSADREFKGTGPVLSWDAATPVWGDDASGHVDLDWTVSGGVLFGKQKTAIRGQEKASYYYGRLTYGPPLSGEPLVTPIDIHRTKSVSAPVIDLSLGLSYEIQRIKVGAGYRWERYFNVLDAGYADHQSYDRTFDGPYFKVAVGFGG